MFDLDKSIAGWRVQMRAAGIKGSAVLDELESHLRDDIQHQVALGLDSQAAFDASISRLGQSDLLKAEFAKLDGAFAQARHLVTTFAGIPDQYLDSDTHLSISGPEPRWATYLRTAIFTMPAFGLWLLNMVFVFPKFVELCKLATYNFGWIQSGIAVARFTASHCLFACAAAAVALLFLELRTNQWPRYRRAVFGAVSFSLNACILFAFSAMVVLSVCGAFQVGYSFRFVDPSMHISPFTMVRFDGNTVDVTYTGTEYRLTAVNSVAASDLITFSRQQYGSIWKKRIAQDLVVVLADSGQPIKGRTVDLTLTDLTTGKQKTVKDATMSAQNRNQLPDTWD